MKLSIGDIGAIITSALAVGGVLIYIGRSLSTLTKVSEGLTALFDKTEQHSKDIARIDKELVEVKTRQEDCGACP